MEEGSFAINFRGLVELLAKNLYPDGQSFIRELIQNSHDSIVKRAATGHACPVATISIDVLSGTQAGFAEEVTCLRISDNGAGMTRRELKEHLATIGRSGTSELREVLLSKDIVRARQLIGKFGIGFLSTFVVAVEITVDTRSVENGAEGLRWHYKSGDERYRIEEQEKKDIGTDILITLKQGMTHLADSERLKAVIRRYADFLPDRILVNGQQANLMQAPWDRSFPNQDEAIDAYTLFIRRRYSEIPLDVVPVNICNPYHVTGLLYIPEPKLSAIDRTGSLEIYQSKMFITSHDRSLLPEWAKFFRGILDSPDFNPTTSRDAIQLDKVYAEVQLALGELLINHLQELASTDRKRFELLMALHHFHIKGMAIGRPDFFQAVANMVLFETNASTSESGKSGELMCLNDYLAAQREAGQVRDSRTIIYYFSETESQRQNHRLCAARKLLVINASGPFEEEFLKQYANLHSNSISLQRVDKSIITDPLPKDDDTFFALQEYVATWCRKNVRVQNTIVTVERFDKTLPAFITIRHNEKMLDKTDSIVRDGDLGVPVTLHLNASNAFISKLATLDYKHPRLRQIIGALYSNAILCSIDAFRPEMLSSIHDQFCTTLSDLLINHERLLETEAQLSTVERSLRLAHMPRASEKYTSMFLMMPFSEEYNRLESALKFALEQPPFCFRLWLAKDLTFKPEILPNVLFFIENSNCYAAEISDQNPNVMFELGVAMAMDPDRPIILLKRSDGRKLPADVQHKIYVEYSFPADETQESISQSAEAISAVLRRNSAIISLVEQSEERYLSPIFLMNILRGRLTEQECERICNEFRTIEQLLGVDTSMIESNCDLDEGIGTFIVSRVRAAITRSQPLR